MSATLHLGDLQAAIVWWRTRRPDAAALATLEDLQTRLLAAGLSEWPAQDLPDDALDAWLSWYDSTPDSPCIAICTTAQGDPICKGCGRSFDEVQNWLALEPLEKRAVWRRITRDGTAWRFNRYAERG